MAKKKKDSVKEERRFQNDYSHFKNDYIRILNERPKNHPETIEYILGMLKENFKSYMKCSLQLYSQEFKEYDQIQREQFLEQLSENLSKEILEAHRQYRIDQVNYYFKEFTPSTYNRRIILYVEELKDKLEILKEEGFLTNELRLFYLNGIPESFESLLNSIKSDQSLLESVLKEEGK